MEYQKEAPRMAREDLEDDDEDWGDEGGGDDFDACADVDVDID